MKIFSERLIELRKSHNLTKSAVANAANIVLRTYQRYENDERVPDIDVACELAKFFSVSLDYLCGLTDEKS